jgi:hypothetical protein
MAARGDLAAWQREAKNRTETAKRCEALALLRIEDDQRFVGDLFAIGVGERGQIAAAGGTLLPCAVLDRTGEGLPIDAAPLGIERFDVTRSDWSDKFVQWLNAARSEPRPAK